MPQIYIPYVCNIESVAQQDKLTLITTEIDHTFVVGSLVKFQVPPQYGMRELSDLKAYVISVPAPDQVLLNLNTTGFTPFSIPIVDPLIVLDPAQIIPAGDANSGTLAPGGVLESLTIPGAYQAIVL
jgi:hypothetical protein